MDALSAYEREIQRHVDEGAVLVDQAHRSKRIPAAAQRFGGTSCVFINELAFPSDAERLWALRHEMAHHENAGLYSESTPEAEIARIEYRARKETVESMVGFEDYCGALLHARRAGRLLEHSGKARADGSRNIRAHARARSVGAARESEGEV